MGDGRWEMEDRRDCRYSVWDGAGGELSLNRRQQLVHQARVCDPAKNLEAGTWYLARAMTRWKNQMDPIPFALAEYNAGPSRAQRWAGGDDAIVISPEDFRSNIEFPGTRKYVDSIIDNVHWLGFDWEDRVFFASDYFEQIYQWALELIRRGRAFVCDLSAEEMRKYRGTLTEPAQKRAAHRGSVPLAWLDAR